MGSQGKNDKGLNFNPPKGGSLVADGSYYVVNNAQLMKTTNSFFPRNSELDKQLKMQLSGIKPNRNQGSPGLE